jgi:3-oxoacyl-[acyl-carrier protein] reductase
MMSSPSTTPSVANKPDSRVAIVTGASRGIGRATALELARQGHRLVLIARSRPALDTLASEIRSLGSGALVIESDLSDRTSALRAVDALNSSWAASATLLVNNAGYGGPFEPLDHVSDLEFDRVFQVNVGSLFALCRALLPRMRDARFGRIVNIASIQGQFGAAGSTTYVASKHAVIGYTRAIAVEWGKHNIRCNAIAAGYVDTDMLSLSKASPQYRKQLEARIAAGRVGRPEDIARTVAWLCGPDTDYINGAVINVDGGITADLGVPDWQ